MATILKSDEMATNSLGSLLLSLLPGDGLTGYFDFSSGQYILRDESVGLADVVNVTRSSSADGVGKNGELVTFPANTPRFHMVQSVGKYGLASGDNMMNYFLNSDAPASQSITFSEGANRRFFLLVRAEGTGSVTVEGVGVEPFTVNGGEENVVKMTSTSNTINVTVSGDLSYVQVSRVTSPYGVDPSMPHTLSSITEKVQDVNGLNTSKVAEAFSVNGNATVFLKMVRFDGGDLGITPHLNNNIEAIVGELTPALGGYVSNIIMLDGTSGSMYIRKQKGGSVLEMSPSVSVPIGKTNVIAATLSPTQGGVFCNGVFSKMQGQTTDEVEPYLRRLPSLPNTTSSNISPNMIICNFIIYDRILDDEDILKIYDLLK